jgi:iron complex transport system ATP-binding protein
MSVIRMESVSCRRGDTTILNDLNWTVEPGQHWAIIGSNGAGKTTLLNIVNGYTWPTTGTVEVLGETFGRVNMSELRTRIGWVSSSMTEHVYQSRPEERALDVVISGKYASIGIWTDKSVDDDEQALEILEMFQCAHLADQPFHILSQGEKQRILIARAWMAKPELLILDEPCTGLDIKARETLLRTIESLYRQNHGPTLLYVTHHPEEVLPLFSHALVLKQGKVLASGEKGHVLTSALLSKAFDVEVDVAWQANRPWVHVIG